MIDELFVLNILTFELEWDVTPTYVIVLIVPSFSFLTKEMHASSAQWKSVGLLTKRSYINPLKVTVAKFSLHVSLGNTFILSLRGHFVSSSTIYFT